MKTAAKDRLVERLLKLKELAMRGEPGERDNARRRIEAICKEHHISLDDMESIERKERGLCLQDEFRKSLMIQIVGVRYPGCKFRMLQAGIPKKSQKIIDEYSGVRNTDSLITCSDAELIEIMYLLDLYDVEDGVVTADGRGVDGEHIRTDCICRECGHVWHPRRFEYEVGE